MDNYCVDVVNYLWKINNILRMHYDQMRNWDHMPNPWGYGKGKDFPQNLSKIIEINYF